MSIICKLLDDCRTRWWNFMFYVRRNKKNISTFIFWEFIGRQDVQRMALNGDTGTMRLNLLIVISDHRDCNRWTETTPTNKTFLKICYHPRGGLDLSVEDWNRKAYHARRWTPRTSGKKKSKTIFLSVHVHTTIRLSREHQNPTIQLDRFSSNHYHQRYQGNSSKRSRKHPQQRQIDRRH